MGLQRYFCSSLSLFLVVTLPSEVTMTSSYNDYIRLYNDMIQGGHDPHVRPVLNQSEALTVYVEFHVISLLSVDEVEQTMELNGWINFSWVDEVRSWEAGDYGDISIVHPDPADMWRPRCVVANSVTKRDPFGNEYMPFYLLNDGRTSWLPGTILSVSCEMDFTYFPFDQQVCSVTFFSTATSDEIRYAASTDSDAVTEYSTNGEWDIAFELYPFDLNYPNSLAAFKVDFLLKRRPIFFVYNVLVPLVILSGLASLVFVLPETSGERASYATTMLLSQSLFMGSVTGDLPQRSDAFPIIILYIFCLLILSSVCVIATVLKLRFFPDKTQDLNSNHDNESGETSNTGTNHNDSHTNISDQDTPVEIFHTAKDYYGKFYRSSERNNVVKIPRGRTAVSPGDSLENLSRSNQQRHQETRYNNVGEEHLLSYGDVTNESNLNKNRSRSCGYVTDTNFLLFTAYVIVWLGVNVYFIGRLAAHR